MHNFLLHLCTCERCLYSCFLVPICKFLMFVCKYLARDQNSHPNLFCKYLDFNNKTVFVVNIKQFKSHNWNILSTNWEIINFRILLSLGKSLFQTNLFRIDVKSSPKGNYWSSNEKLSYLVLSFGFITMYRFWKYFPWYWNVEQVYQFSIEFSGKSNTNLIKTLGSRYFCIMWRHKTFNTI